MIFINGTGDSLLFYYKHNLRYDEQLSCLIKNHLITDYPDNFLYYQLNELDDNSKWEYALSKSDVGLVIEINNPIEDYGFKIIDALEEYYG